MGTTVLEKAQKPFTATRNFYDRFGTGPRDPNDPYYYRTDAISEFDRIKGFAFNLARKQHTMISDRTAFSTMLAALPPDKGLFRLSWFTSWQDACEQIPRWADLKQPRVLHRILKTDLHSIPGLQFMDDPMLPTSAVHSYIVEDLQGKDPEYSQVGIPFEAMDFLLAAFDWHPAAPKSIDVPDPEPDPTPFDEEYFATGAMVHAIAQGARRMRSLFEYDKACTYEFAAQAYKALRVIGVHPGSTTRKDLLLALLKASGEAVNFDPSRLGSGLLLAVCLECRRIHQPWEEGVAELRRRQGLKGLHRFVWSLRDKGILSMNRELRIGDPEPRFP